MRRCVRLLALLAAVAFVALQLFFVARIALMARGRSAVHHLPALRGLAPRARERGRIALAASSWVAVRRRSPTDLKRAVIASEDAGFIDHGGVEWEAIEKAWERNASAPKRSAEQRRARRRATRGARQAGAAAQGASAARPSRSSWPRTCSCRGERTLLRKGQELVLACALEALLDKQRILEIYLNNVEWGEGVFGAEAAAQHYFRSRRGAARRRRRRRGWR